MLTLSAVVHLSAYILAHDMGHRAAIRERLALSVGSLKSIKGTWLLAGSVLQSIKGAAREVMAMGKSVNKPPSGDASEPFHANGNNDNPWAVTMNDPLFTQVPDLLPSHNPPSMAPTADPGRAMPVGASIA